MMNPSVADEVKNDATVRKCVGFAKRWGFAGMAIVNLIPIVSTDPWALPPWSGYHLDNEAFLLAAMAEYSPIIVAWGSVPTGVRRRVALIEHRLRFYELVGNRPLFCIGQTKGGDPVHPSRAPYTEMYDSWENPLCETSAPGVNGFCDALLGAGPDHQGRKEDDGAAV